MDHLEDPNNIDYLENSNIPIAWTNFIIILGFLLPAVVLYGFYRILNEEAKSIYRSLFEALAPFLGFLAIVFAFWFIATTIGNPILDVLLRSVHTNPRHLLQNVYSNLRHSVYLQARRRSLRRRFYSRKTSLALILSSKLYKRLTNKMNSNYLIVLQYFVLVVSLLLLPIGIIWELLQREVLLLGEIGTRSTIWTIAQLHFASISFGLVIIVFALNFLERNISPLEHGPLLIRDALLVRTIISATMLSLLILLFILLGADIPDQVYGFLVLFNFVLFIVVILSVFLIVERIIRIFLRSSEEIHLSSVKAKLVDLSLFGREKQNAIEILNDTSTSISKEVTQASIPCDQITAHDIGIRPGHYIVDVNKKNIRDVLQNTENKPIHARFELSIGDEITKGSDPILSIVNEVEPQRIKEVKQELRSAVQSQGFDQQYDQDSWEQEYNIIDYLINQLEQNVENCIRRRNLSSLEYNLYMYRQIVWTATYHSTFQSLHFLPKNPVDSVFRSIHRVFHTCLESPDISKDIQHQILWKITHFVYLLSNDIRKEFGKRPEVEKGKELLEQFEKAAKGDDQELVEEIRSLLRELE